MPTVRRSSRLLDSTGAYCLAEATEPRLLISTISENTNVARNSPSVTRVTRDWMNTRTVRGEYWLAASWIATSVVAKTTATNASVAAAIAPPNDAAVDGSLTRPNRTPTGAAILPSNQTAR